MGTDRHCAGCGGALDDGAVFCGECGTPTSGAAAPIGGVTPIPVVASTGRDGRRWGWVVVGALVAAAVVIGALIGVVLNGRSPDAKAVEVVLEGVGSEAASPFTETVVSEGVVPADLVGFSTASSSGSVGPSSAGVVVSQVSGDRAGLYGSTSAGPVCSPEGLALRVAADPAVERVWAGVMGLDAAEVDPFIKGLTPVVLGRDTAVTNHAYGADGARAFQSVLEAGTPVLVDATGAPRVRCSCGNPLLAPAVEGRDVEVVGERWPGFDPREVSEIRPSADPVTEIQTVDVDTRQPVSVAVGAEPAPDTVELDGLLVADAAGVHVDSEAGERLATVIGQPVERVFDDGAGGLLYNLRRPDSPVGGRTFPEFDTPGSDELATLWHLPAGAVDPVPLIGSDDPTRRWAVAEATGTLGGRRVLAYADLTGDPDAEEELQLSGRLVVRDLDSGEDRVVEEAAFGYELGTSSVTIAGDRIAYENGYAYSSWALRDAALAEVGSPCNNPEDEETECVQEGALADASTLVGLASSETGESVSLQVDDLVSGGHRSLDVEIGGYLGDWDGDMGVDALDGRAVVSFAPRDGSEAFPMVLVDVASGSTTEVDLSGIVRFLRAPLIRPADAAAEPPAPTTEAPPPTTEASPPTTAPAGPEESADVGIFLSGFFDAWLADDREAMVRYAPDDVVDGFLAEFPPADFIEHGSFDTCGPASCEGVVGPAGGGYGLIVQIAYHVAEDGFLTIDSLSFGGDTG